MKFSFREGVSKKEENDDEEEEEGIKFLTQNLGQRNLFHLMSSAHVRTDIRGCLRLA